MGNIKEDEDKIKLRTFYWMLGGFGFVSQGTSRFRFVGCNLP